MGLLGMRLAQAEVLNCTMSYQFTKITIINPQDINAKTTQSCIQAHDNIVVNATAAEFGYIQYCIS